MLEIKINKSKTEIAGNGDKKIVVVEAIMGNVVLTKFVASQLNITYEAAALMIMQQGSLANKNAMAQLEKMSEEE